MKPLQSSKGKTLRNALLGAIMLSTLVLPTAQPAWSQCMFNDYTTCLECDNYYYNTCLTKAHAQFNNCLETQYYGTCSRLYASDQQGCADVFNMYIYQCE